MLKDSEGTFLCWHGLSQRKNSAWGCGDTPHRLTEHLLGYFGSTGGLTVGPEEGWSEVTLIHQRRKGNHTDHVVCVEGESAERLTAHLLPRKKRKRVKKNARHPISKPSLQRETKTGGNFVFPENPTTVYFWAFKGNLTFFWSSI